MRRRQPAEQIGERAELCHRIVGRAADGEEEWIELKTEERRIELTQVELEQAGGRVPVAREATELEAPAVGVGGLDPRAQRLQLGGLGVLPEDARRCKRRAEEGVAAGEDLCADREGLVV